MSDFGVSIIFKASRAFLSELRLFQNLVSLNVFSPNLSIIENQREFMTSKKIAHALLPIQVSRRHMWSKVSDTSCQANHCTLAPSMRDSTSLAPCRSRRTVGGRLTLRAEGPCASPCPRRRGQAKLTRKQSECCLAREKERRVV